MIEASIIKLVANRKRYNDAGGDITGVQLTAEYPLQAQSNPEDTEWAEIELDLPLGEAPNFYIGGVLRLEYGTAGYPLKGAPA